MSLIDSAHQLAILSHIPAADLDEEEVCLISHTPYSELSSSGHVVQLTCHGARKYLDPQLFFQYIQSLNETPVRCLQCRSIIDVSSISELELEATFQRRAKLLARIDELDAEVKTLEFTGSKVQDYILALNFLIQHQNPIYEEVAQINVERASLKVKLKEQEIRLAREQEANVGFDNPYSLLHKLENELFQLKLNLYSARDALKALQETNQKDVVDLQRTKKYSSHSNSDLLSLCDGILGVSSAAIVVSLAFPLLAYPALIATLFYSLDQKEPLQELYSRYKNGLL